MEYYILAGAYVLVLVLIIRIIFSIKIKKGVK